MRRHLSYANVVATLALVFAMSGGALAAKHYLVNSTKQFNPKVLKSFASTNTSLFKKLSKTVVVTKAVTATSAATAGLATNASHASSATTATSAGTAGSATTAGTANALNGVQIVRGPDATNLEKSQESQTVSCPAGLHALGGGIQNSGGIEQSVNEMFITSTGAETNNAFKGNVNNTGAATDTFHVWVICATASVSGKANN